MACRVGGRRRWAEECGRWAGGEGELLAVMCAACPQNVPPTISPWTSHLLLLHQMMEAGCHFAPDDLTIQEWLGLSSLKGAIQTDATEAAKATRRGDGPQAVFNLTR